MRTLRELWQGRRLLLALVARDLRTRHAGSVAGLAWAVFTPLIQLLILTTVFSLVLQIRLGGATGEVPFAITLAWGFFPWLAFQDGVGRAASALVDGGILVRRMAFPPAVLIAQPVLTALVQLLIALVLLVLAMPLLGLWPSATLPFIVLPFVLGGVLALGVGLLAGVGQVYFRDTSEIVKAALQAWFYLTPIVYTLDVAPAGLRWILALNPLCGVVDGYRAFALGFPVPVSGLLWSASMAAAIFLAGCLALGRARDEVADLV